MSNWAEQIEDDLKWREAELGSLKMATAAAQSGSDRQRALLRALWTMLYAHYEGFYKFCWDLLLDQMEKDGCARSDAKDPIAIFSLAKVFKEMRKDISSEGIWEFVKSTFPNEMKQPLSFPIRLETKANLWPSVAEENNEAIGLKCKEVAAYEAQLKALVGRRNEIAHGRKLVVNNLQEYELYEKAVMIVLHELAVVVVDTLSRRTFAKSSSQGVQLPLSL